MLWVMMFMGNSVVVYCFADRQIYEFILKFWTLAKIGQLMFG